MPATIDKAMTNGYQMIELCLILIFIAPNDMWLGYCWLISSKSVHSMPAFLANRARRQVDRVRKIRLV